MFAVSAGIQTVLELGLGAVLAAIILGIGRAAMQLMQSRQTQRRNEDYDQRTLSEFFFDTPKDHRTGTPAKVGWTTKVDQTLEELKASQVNTARLVREILREVKEDGNGDHNLRGLVKRGAKAAGAAMPPSDEES